MNSHSLTEDPFKILDVNYGDNLQTIRERFKALVLRYHPDRKNGNAEMFQKVKNSYAYIYKFKKNQQNHKKKQNRTFENFLQERKIADKINSNQQTRKQILQPNNLDQNAFNNIFEKNKILTAYDAGREEFLKNETNAKKKAIVVVKDPKIFADSMDVAELGVETVDDFSTYTRKKESNKISCADIKYAYENKEILQGNMKNIRQDSFLRNASQVEHLQNQRQNISYEMSPQEKLWYDMKQKEIEEDEQKRLHFVNKQKEISERQFLRVSKYLTQ